MRLDGAHADIQLVGDLGVCQILNEQFKHRKLARGDRAGASPAWFRVRFFVEDNLWRRFLGVLPPGWIEHGGDDCVDSRRYAVHAGDVEGVGRQPVAHVFERLLMPPPVNWTKRYAEFLSRLGSDGE